MVVLSMRRAASHGHAAVHKELAVFVSGRQKLSAAFSAAAVRAQTWVGGEEEDEEQTVSCRHNTPNVHKHGLDTLLVSAPLIPTVRLDGTVTSGNVLTAPPPTILSADLTT
ncbi:hypothetical protein J6590_096157 [Homalodisca vitripennis]|nr:hypothetical protein J6590_096157 [Homalodisca vitripennis]